MEDEYQEVLEDFEFRTGEKPKGMMKVLLGIIVTRLSFFFEKLKFIEKQAFPDTCDKEYLWKHTGEQLPPLSADFAQGEVVFFGERNTVVSIGTIIKDEESTYRTLASVVITEKDFTERATIRGDKVVLPPQVDVPSTQCDVNGTMVMVTSTDKEFIFPNTMFVSDRDMVTVKVIITPPVEVISSEVGVIHNREFNDRLNCKIKLNGVNKEVKVINISGGKDDEEIEDYRQRVLTWMRSPEPHFSENHIIGVLLRGIPTLKYVWVKGGEVKEGEVTIFVMNKNYSLNINEREKINKLIKNILPAQMSFTSHIHIDVPIIKETHIIIKDLKIKDVPNVDDAIKNEIKKNLEFLFLDDLFEQAVTTGNIEGVIYRTKYHLKRVEKFQLISGECFKENKVFWRLGSVTFT